MRDVIGTERPPSDARHRALLRPPRVSVGSLRLAYHASFRIVTTRPLIPVNQPRAC